MLAADSLGESFLTILWGIGISFANVAYAGSLILSFVMVAIVLIYAKRRPVGTPLSWGEAMLSATYVTFGLFWAFGVVPHQWLTYAQGELNMRSDSILAGPGSTGLFEWVPVVISKQTVADLVCVMIYGMYFTLGVALWAIWQGRGQKKSDEIETSTYGRPLVKS